jgi:hypothetical protein
MVLSWIVLTCHARCSLIVQQLLASVAGFRSAQEHAPAAAWHACRLLYPALVHSGQLLVHHFSFMKKKTQKSPVPETDTGRLVENTKGRERTLSKELGKLAP